MYFIADNSWKEKYGGIILLALKSLLLLLGNNQYYNLKILPCCFLKDLFSLYVCVIKLPEI
jgi:hypothetical protein